MRPTGRAVCHKILRGDVDSEDNFYINQCCCLEDVADFLGISEEEVLDKCLNSLKKRVELVRGDLAVFSFFYDGSAKVIYNGEKFIEFDNTIPESFRPLFEFPIDYWEEVTESYYIHIDYKEFLEEIKKSLSSREVKISFLKRVYFNHVGADGASYGNTLIELNLKVYFATFSHEGVKYEIGRGTPTDLIEGRKLKPEVLEYDLITATKIGDTKLFTEEKNFRSFYIRKL